MSVRRETAVYESVSVGRETAVCAPVTPAIGPQRTVEPKKLRGVQYFSASSVLPIRTVRLAALKLHVSQPVEAGRVTAYGDRAQGSRRDGLSRK